jgi:cyclopropane fatty-acyl-phospholipid synthase-like methyltransferase
MTMKPETRFDDCCQAFAESYEISNLPAVREVERTVLGCDYGGTSWTTSTQAAQIMEVLNLQPGVQLLEIGAGSGWPGVYLADASGCDVTLVDLPINALAMARERARADGIEDRVWQIAASGSALPFRNRCFEAISHSDVLCCMPQKTEMLRECRRVAADRAKMLFSVIAMPRALSESARRRAMEAGPPFIDAPDSYGELLARSGWQLIRRTDAAPEYRKSLCALVKAFENCARLSDALGRDFVAEARERRQEQIAAIDAGILVRDIYLAAAR